MIYVISSVHPLSDSRIYHRQVKSLAKLPGQGFLPGRWRAASGGHRLHSPCHGEEGLRIRLKNFFILWFGPPCPGRPGPSIFMDPELMLVGLAAKVLAKRWSTMCMKTTPKPSATSRQFPNHCAVWSACCINGWKNSVVAV